MTSWPTVLLSEVLAEAEAGFACGKGKHVPVGVVQLRPFNIGEDLDLRLDQVYQVPEAEARSKKVGLVAGDVLFNNTNSADQVGKVAYVGQDMKVGFSNHLTRLRFQSDRIVPAFAAVVLQRLWRRRYFEQRCTRWISQAAFNSKALKGLEIPLPPLEEQHRIVDILNRANGILRLRREAFDKTRQLIPALFVDMFGDPRQDEGMYTTLPLREVAEIGSGIAKGRKLEGEQLVEVPYIRVANVQDGFLNLKEIKQIPIRRSELAKYALKAGDLLMTEGGDPDKLGRAALWNNDVPDCVHQNHVFRVRARPDLAEPLYLRALAGSLYGKQYFLRVAKRTTGIASINKTQLGNFPVLLPPLGSQREFSEHVADIQATIAQQERMAKASDQLVASLMAQLFDAESERQAA